MIDYEVIWFRNWIRIFILCQVSKCSSLIRRSFLIHFLSNSLISMMSIFPQMSGFDLWMIINLSDSDTDLKISSFTKFLNVILPFVGLFWKELFLMIRCLSLFVFFHTTLLAWWASFPKWVVSICDWLSTYLIQTPFKSFFFYEIFKCHSTPCWSFLKWVVPFDSLFLFVSVFFHTTLLAWWTSFPKWVVPICDWLWSHLIQKLN